MDKRVLMGVLIFICLCFRASNCYAWDELPVAVIDPADEPVAICYGESKVFDGSQSYDPDIPYWGWVIWYNWCITDYYGGTFECTGYSSNDTYVFDSLQWGPGIYRIDLWVIDDEYNESADCDSRIIYVVNVTIDDDPPTRDTTEWLPYQPPRLADIYYTIEPDSAWTPGSVWFYVRQGATLIDIEELPAEIGRQHTTWDGKDFNGNLVEPGEYTAIIEAEAGDLTCSGTHPITVVKIQLESVTFGGTNKHTLYKKDDPNDPIDRWDPDNEDYASDYALAVPDKAWVRNPALSDPVCYTKGSVASQCTATIELSIDPPMIEPGATITGKHGSCTWFLTTAPISGSSATIGPIIAVTPLANAVGGAMWEINWYVNLGDVDDIVAGTSQNKTYLVWGPPSGSQVTAKRIRWAAWLNCSGDTTVTQLGNHTASGVQNRTVFGDGNPIPEWAALDNEPPPYSDPDLENDCLASSMLAKKGLLLLGVPSADLGTQKSYASSDKTGNPDYPSDVTNTEYLDWWLLVYTDNDGLDWNDFEASFRAKDGDLWRYWTCFPLNGPFIGTGANAPEKDKSARYQVLDKIRDDNGLNFYQKYGGEGPKVTLP